MAAANPVNGTRNMDYMISVTKGGGQRLLEQTGRDSGGYVCRQYLLPAHTLPRSRPQPNHLAREAVGIIGRQ